MDDIWLYLSMPLICAVVGYGTNWVCIKMMCYPIKFVGIKPPYLGWQGVVPRRAPHIAGIQVDLMTKHLIKVEDIFDQIDPTRITEELEPVMLGMIRELTDELMEEQAPRVWEALPVKIKDRIYKRASNDAPEVVAAMMSDIQNNINDVFDLKAMVMDAFVKDRSMLVKMFEEIGYKEFKFVQNSGLWFGFLFGCVQMVLWVFYQEAWILPAIGILVGAATNWLAINMIFSPKHPIKIGPITLHGLFIKRQDEVAVDFGLLIAREILNPENIVNGILKGPSSDKLFDLIQRNVKRTMDEYAGYTKPFITMAIGTKRYIEIKNMAVERIMQQLPGTMHLVHDYTEEAMDINATLRSKMTQLTPEQFEGMLRPAFEEDEWQLVALGAVIGFFVGWAQLVFMFGGTL
ncbi:hypothetical protein A9Q99_17865 [Gammaproteobacteria bacterium 45_16_T64]|nr:hypothetical protein A9Q99_17865 [Gammaproteobacteria bacterium 45_16_T64]